MKPEDNSGLLGSCETCQFSHKTSYFDQFECRCMPPVLVPGEDRMSPSEGRALPKWPLVNGCHWCGQWESEGAKKRLK